MWRAARRWRLAPACLFGLVCAGATVAALADGPARPAGGWDVQRLRAAAARLGTQAVAGALALEALVSSASGLDEAARVQAANRFINERVRFRDDAQVWGQADYWATPLETLSKSQGDCEDYAIAKYFSLRALGVPANRLRLVYVRAWLNGTAGPSLAHMVLAYQPTAQAEPAILDNLVPDVRPASNRPDLTPVFSFNAEGLWQGNGAMPAGDPTARLSRWREVLMKTREEGFP